jgi:hypothetical protein
MCFTSVSCNNPRSTGWEWKIFKAPDGEVTPPPTIAVEDEGLWQQYLGSHNKCEKPSGESQVTVEMAECQQMAIDDGREYFSYYAPDKQCFTSVTCNNPRSTGWVWKMFKAPDGEVTPPPTTAAEDDGLWPQYLGSHNKCEKPSGESQMTLDKAECQELAMDQGRHFFSYYAPDKMCFTSVTCNDPRSTGWVWKMFKEPGEPTPAPTPVEEEGGWPQYRGNHYKCEKPSGESQVTLDKAECQQKAIDEGRAFFSYYSPDKQCFTSVTCDSPRSTGWEWRMFKHVPEEVAEGGGWPLYLGVHNKCAKPSGESIVYLDKAECQQKAEGEGRPFFSYYVAERMCFSSPTCDSPVTTGYPWMIFSEPE